MKGHDFHAAPSGRLQRLYRNRLSDHFRKAASVHEEDESMGRMMGRVSSRLARVDWFIWAPALFLGAAALLVIGTIAFAAASIRCCADSTGTTATGWIIIGLLVLAAALGAGTIGAGIGWSIRRLARLISHQHRE